MILKIKHFAVLSVFLLQGCVQPPEGSELGRDFYRGSVATMTERIATYSIADQWEIYYYGTTSIHPPDYTLSVPLARNGEPMALYIMSYLDSSREDHYFLNSLDVLERMVYRKYYDYCQNPSIIAKLNANQSLIKDAFWRDFYGEKRTRMPC